MHPGRQASSQVTSVTAKLTSLKHSTLAKTVASPSRSQVLTNLTKDSRKAESKQLPPEKPGGQGHSAARWLERDQHGNESKKGNIKDACFESRACPLSFSKPLQCPVPRGKTVLKLLFKPMKNLPKPKDYATETDKSSFSVLSIS